MSKDEGYNSVTVVDDSDNDSDGDIEPIDGFVGDEERSVNSDIQAVNTENALHEGVVALDDDTTTGGSAVEGMTSMVGV